MTLLDEQVRAAALEAHAAYMLGELARIVRAFEAAAIPLLAYKGPVVSQQLYGNPALRRFSDLDVISSPAQADDAEALLRQLGYRELEPLGESQRRTNRRFAGASLYFSDATGVLVDFHALFSNEQFPLRLPFEDVWKRHVDVVIGELRIPSLGDIDLAIVTCSHAAKHLWHKPDFLTQIAALAKKTIDWSAVDQLAIAARATRQVGLSFLVARDLLGVEPPPVPRCLAASLPLLDRAKALIGERQDATGRDLFVLLDRRRDAVRSLALGLFVPTQTDWHGSTLPAPLQWAARPIRVLARRLRSRLSR